MKNTKKRGFTIVELVIVIAVIAILAAVLIPTFSNVIKKANESKALQNARNTWTRYTVDHATSFGSVNGYVVEDDSKYFLIENGKFSSTEVDKAAVDAKFPTTAVEGSSPEYTVAEHTTACGDTNKDCTGDYKGLFIATKN